MPILGSESCTLLDARPLAASVSMSYSLPSPNIENSIGGGGARATNLSGAVARRSFQRVLGLSTARQLWSPLTTLTPMRWGSAVPKVSNPGETYAFIQYAKNTRGYSIFRKLMGILSSVSVIWLKYRVGVFQKARPRKAGPSRAPPLFSIVIHIKALFHYQSFLPSLKLSYSHSSILRR